MHQASDVDPGVVEAIDVLERSTPVYALAAMSESEIIYSFSGPSELLCEIVDKLREHVVSQAN